MADPTGELLRLPLSAPFDARFYDICTDTFKNVRIKGLLVRHIQCEKRPFPTFTELTRGHWILVAPDFEEITEHAVEDGNY